jgi:hypothetical protein
MSNSPLTYRELRKLNVVRLKDRDSKIASRKIIVLSTSLISLRNGAHGFVFTYVIIRLQM